MPERKRKTPSSPSITVDDVARRAGVSRTAVSYVLNEKGQRNKHVSEEARAKVLQAIQELNFQPHALARALSKGYSEEIAYLVDMPFTPFMVELLSSLQQQALIYGYRPVVYLGQGFSAEERKTLHRTIFARRPLAIIAGCTKFGTEEVAQAREMGVKHIIFIGFHTEPIEGTYTIAF